MKKIRRPQKPKLRNWVAKEIRDPDSIYQHRVEKLRTKYTRKDKYKKYTEE